MAQSFAPACARYGEVRPAAAAHQRGVIVLTCGTYGNVFRFLPPLSIDDELLAEACDVLDEVFEATT